jgi:transposase
MVAIDGSKFKAVNNRDNNFTTNKIQRRREQIEASIERYLSTLETADRQEKADFTEAKIQHLQEKIALLKEQMAKLDTIEDQLQATPDKQISLTDPDARSMATSGRGTGIVGYNVQTAVDTKNHLIVAHEVTNVGHDRTQLAHMAKQAKPSRSSSNLAICQGGK